MRPRNHPKQQHYVPRFLLKGFTSGKKHRLYAYDKQTDRVFPTNPDKVAVENGFYDFSFEGATLTAEPAMGSLEDAASPAIKRIVAQESLASVTDDERRLLSVFVAVQHARTRNLRHRLRDMTTQLIERVRAMGFPTEDMEMSEDDAAWLSTDIALGTHEFAPFVYDKAWVLFKNDGPVPYYTSDNPVTLQNFEKFGPYGNIGFAVPGIEIYLPLSRTLTLCMFCRSREEQAQSIVEKAGTLGRALPLLASELRERAAFAEKLLDSVRRGTPMVQSRDNVVNVNSLQVRYAERYVYSATDEFSLVRRMLQDNPGLRFGPRAQVG